VEVQKPGCPADTGNCGCHNRGGDQSKNVAEPVECEVQTEVSLNQPTGQQSFAGVAYSEHKRTHQRAVTHKVGNDRCNGRTDSNRQSRTRTKCDQGASRNSRCGPENSNSVRLGQKEQAEACRKKIGNADQNRETNPVGPQPTRPLDRQFSLDTLRLVQQNLPPSTQVI